ncbi:hypothetical protein [Desulfocurvus vexinensis]|uniref:hypothetical protein n=1 Tax=Desulfocurvus vexinensis TaxID=399548 RepID=UPI0004B35A40|nr:hypothetical protein [Desulfocurvus vexinensis]
MYQYPDGTEHRGLPPTVERDGVQYYTARLAEAHLVGLGYRRIVDVTEVPPGQQRASTYTDAVVDGRVLRTYDLEPEPAPSPEARREEILAELTALDAASARPLRAVLTAQTAGQPPAAEDVARLADLEAQAQALRTELAGLAE